MALKDTCVWWMRTFSEPKEGGECVREGEQGRGQEKLKKKKNWEVNPDDRNVDDKNSVSRAIYSSPPYVAGCTFWLMNSCHKTVWRFFFFLVNFCFVFSLSFPRLTQSLFIAPSSLSTLFNMSRRPTLQYILTVDTNELNLSRQATSVYWFVMSQRVSACSENREHGCEENGHFCY